MSDKKEPSTYQVQIAYVDPEQPEVTIEKIVDIDLATIRICGSLSSMLADLGGSGDGEKCLPLPYHAQFGVEASEKAIEFAKHYSVNPLPKEGDNTEYPEEDAAEPTAAASSTSTAPKKISKPIEINDFEKAFIESLITKDEAGKQDFKLYWNVYKTSEHIDIVRLVKVMASHIANILKDRTPDEIRSYYDLKKVLTDEQEQKLRDEIEKME